MNNKKINKIDILLEAKNKIFGYLNDLEPIKFVNSDLYIVDKDFYNKLLEIEDTLLPLQTNSRRGQAYSINKIVRIIDPINEAFSYKLTQVWKSSLVTKKSKILDYLDKEKEISKNIILSNVKKTIDNGNFTYDEISYINKNANNLINEELKNFNDIKANPENYELIITNYVERKLHGQIGWSYYEGGDINKKKTGQRHLSIEVPNILIFNNNLEVRNERRDKKVDLFIKDAFKAFGNVYAKRKGEILD